MTPLDEARCKLLQKAFRMPSVQTMVSRKSSITNSFVNAIIPPVVPAPEEIDQALTILELDPSNLSCAYCGNRSTEWDHLRPLVLGRRPTGYISEIANLVPSCAKCNQSKGNSNWREWMLGGATHSPTRRAVPNVAERVARLEAFERWRPPTKIDFVAILGPEEWDRYWASCEAVIEDMKKCKEAADQLRAKISETMKPFAGDAAEEP
jgi:hypothetical protein